MKNPKRKHPCESTYRLLIFAQVRDKSWNSQKKEAVKHCGEWSDMQKICFEDSFYMSQIVADGVRSSHIYFIFLSYFMADSICVVIHYHRHLIQPLFRFIYHQWVQIGTINVGLLLWKILWISVGWLRNTKMRGLTINNFKVTYLLL